VNPEDSKEYSWKWVTADELLCKTPCEICTILVSCEDGNCEVKAYDGEDATGRLVAHVKCSQYRSFIFNSHHHVYCRRGLYIDVDVVAHTEGVFVQWLERPEGIEY